jgi:hypothetical protein
MLGLTDREHFAALFLNGMHQVTGAHIVAVGGQHGIGTIEARTVFRAAIAACASGVVLGHYVPRNIMPPLLPTGLCARSQRRPASNRWGDGGSPHNGAPSMITTPVRNDARPWRSFGDLGV